MQGCLLVSTCYKYVMPVLDGERSWLSQFEPISQMVQELQPGINQDIFYPAVNSNLSHRWVMGFRSLKFGIIPFDAFPCLLVSSALCFLLWRLVTLHCAECTPCAVLCGTSPDFWVTATMGRLDKNGAGVFCRYVNGLVHGKIHTFTRNLVLLQEIPSDDSSCWKTPWLSRVEIHWNLFAASMEPS